jgi:ribosomal protein L29
MKKSDSKPIKETLEEELNRLRKENAKLKSQKETNKAKMSEMKKELKKKGATTVTITEEQRKLLLPLSHKLYRYSRT